MAVTSLLFQANITESLYKPVIHSERFEESEKAANNRGKAVEVDPHVNPETVNDFN